MGNELRAPDNEDIGRWGECRACCAGGYEIDRYRSTLVNVIMGNCIQGGLVAGYLSTTPVGTAGALASRNRF